jgi:hypothetical protein
MKEADKQLKSAHVQEHKQLCVDIFCAAIAATEKGTARIVKALREENPEFPPHRTLRTWIDEDEKFSAQYARAKELQAEYIFDQILDISDDSSEDELFVGGDDDSGAGAKRVLNSEFVQRSKLKVDARKWVLSKLLPKKYGDKIEQTLQNPDGSPVQYSFNIHPPENRD